MPLRVLHVLCDLAGGGAERLVLDLCRRAPQQVDCTVAGVHPGGPLLPEFTAAGIPVLCADRRRGRPGGRALSALTAWSRRADVVHTHGWAGDAWGLPAALIARRPVRISTEHNTRADTPSRGRSGALLRHLAHRIIAVSDAAADTLAIHERRRVAVIPNGIDLDRFAPAPLPAPEIHRRDVPLRVLAMGRLTHQKGLDVLIRAAVKTPGVTVDVIGEGEDHAALQSLISRADAPVTLSGWQRDVRPHLARCHVVAMPSRWEGFGLAAVEALAAGRPVIASRVDMLPELIGAAGLVVPADDVPALSRALALLRDDRELLEELARCAPAQATRFDIRHTVAETVRLYKDEIARRRMSALSGAPDSSP